MGKKNKMKFTHILLKEKKTLCGVKPNTKMILVDRYEEVTCTECKYRMFSQRVIQWFDAWLLKQGLPTISTDILPTLGERLANCTRAERISFDNFHIYSEPDGKKEQYLNKWYIQIHKSGVLSQMLTYKRVSEASKRCLYNEEINAVRILISRYDNKTLLKVMIDSIDDSSFGMWHKDITESILNDILTWVHSQKIIDGEEMFKYGKTLGFGNFDYN